MDERDRQLGLGAGGPVASELRRVTIGSRVGVGSTATLVAVVDAEGRTVAVDVASATGDQDAWKDVATGVLEAMRGKRIGVPKAAHGLRLAFSVETRSRTASGHETSGRSPVFVTPDNARAERSPSLVLGTPVYRCLEGCTASANLDPSDALVNATNGAARTVHVKALPPERLP